jgi:hypothetical protein
MAFSDKRCPPIRNRGCITQECVIVVLSLAGAVDGIPAEIPRSRGPDPRASSKKQILVEVTIFMD